MLSSRRPLYGRLAAFDLSPGIIVSEMDPALIEGLAVRFELDPTPYLQGPLRGNLSHWAIAGVAADERRRTNPIQDVIFLDCQAHRVAIDRDDATIEVQYKLTGLDRLAIGFLV